MPSHVGFPPGLNGGRDTQNEAFLVICTARTLASAGYPSNRNLQSFYMSMMAALRAGSIMV
jgi:hypothetical protein